MLALFNFAYSELEKFKDNIFKISKDKLILQLKKEYKLKGMISLQMYEHYIWIIFNPIGSIINKYFKASNIYYYDGRKINGNICMLKKGEDWKDLEIPYINK